MSEQEKTPTGDPIYRYDDSKQKDFEFAIGDELSIDAISQHIERHVGKVESVFHEIVSNIVHIDIHWVKPTSRFPFHTLVTSGMSDKAMTVPEGCEEHKFAELCVLLPPDWNIQFENDKLLDEELNDEINCKSLDLI